MRTYLCVYIICVYLYIDISLFARAYPRTYTYTSQGVHVGYYAVSVLELNGESTGKENGDGMHGPT